MREGCRSEEVDELTLQGRGKLGDPRTRRRGGIWRFNAAGNRRRGAHRASAPASDLIDLMFTYMIPMYILTYTGSTIGTRRRRGRAGGDPPGLLRLVDPLGHGGDPEGVIPTSGPAGLASTPW